MSLSKTTMHWFQCAPGEISMRYAQKIADWHEAYPGRTITAQQHSTCSIGSPMSPCVVVTLLITAEPSPTDKPNDYSTDPS